MADVAADAAETVLATEEGFSIFPLLIAFTLVVGIYWFYCRPTPPRRGINVPPPPSKVYGGKKSLKRAVEEGKTLIILYGTQTGTAEDFSNRLSQEARKNAFDPMVSDIDECLYQELPELAGKHCVVMFVMATYGEGEPTDNAVDFYNWLKEQEDGSFGKVKYTVFSLGNTTYDHYQFMGREVDTHMTRLGGECAYPRGEGDENKNQEEDFMTWQEAMWPGLCEKMGIDPSTGSQTVQRIYKMQLHTAEDVDAAEEREQARQKSQTFDQKRPCLVKIKEKYELHTEKSDRSCLHVSFSLVGTNLKYSVGDHLGILPENDPELVEWLLQRLEIADPEQAISLSTVEPGGKAPFPGPATIRTVLMRYVDVVQPPRKNALQILADYATDEAEKAELLFLVSNKSPESKKKYLDWIVTPQRSISDVLAHFKSVKIPIDHFIEIMPKLQVRYYSISSSYKADKEIVTVTAAVVEWVTGAGTPRKGVCTNYLKRMAVNSERARVFVRKSSFKPPAPTKPMIMIGPGTGLAPFRGFLQERRLEVAKGTQVGPTVLYFGCRRSDTDYIYREELESFRQDGTLTSLHVAFSREKACKEYVQDLLGREENAEEVWRLMSENKGHLYICGDAKNMAHDVRGVLITFIQRFGKFVDAKAAEQWLEKSKQFSQDVW